MAVLTGRCLVVYENVLGVCDVCCPKWQGYHIDGVCQGFKLMRIVSYNEVADSRLKVRSKIKKTWLREFVM